MKFVDASMTVNSKEALKVVMGMLFEPSASTDLHTSYPEDPNFEQQFAIDTSQLGFFLNQTYILVSFLL